MEMQGAGDVGDYGLMNGQRNGKFQMANFKWRKSAFLPFAIFLLPFAMLFAVCLAWAGSESLVSSACRSNAITGFVNNRNCFRAPGQYDVLQKPFQDPHEASGALNLEAQNNDAVMSAWRETANVGEIQVARHKHSAFFLSGLKKRFIRTPRFKSIQRMHGIMTILDKKLLNFYREILIDEKPHLNGFLELGVKKNLFPSQRCGVFQRCANVFLLQGRIRMQNFRCGHSISDTIHNRGHHDACAFNAGFAVTDIRIDGNSVKHDAVSIQDSLRRATAERLGHRCLASGMWEIMD
jgi:hypothetical protein